ncbi:MAG TPA: hypothetical protein VER33_02185, partial [Polyangiaceae bacterium]|nr:hypothetical protein [Polyangiaceae bacterium]
YRLTPRIGLEVFFGYARLWQDLRRRLRVTDSGDDGFVSDALLDQTRVSTPFAGFGVSRHFLDQTPLVLRLSTGLGRSRIQSAVSGIFLREAGGSDAFPVSLLEHAQSSWVPFLAPEVRFGYRLNRGWTFDLGLGAWLFLAPSYPRRSMSAVPEDREARWVPLVRPGSVAGPVRLPTETALGAHALFALTLGARLDL